MKSWLSLARTAGILYLIFAVFSCGVLWIWLGGTSWQTHREQLPTVPGAVQLLSVIAALTIASVVLGALLTARARVNVVLIIGGAVTAFVALWWNIVAPLFWFAPVAFMFLAYRKQ
jgi:hypothetical protein